ncbi:MAG: hypothetical protein Q7T50_07745 [Candidatus Magasanikbacteria bacterium]|nr:hypothetical protein [Candidatus Magasanikbacteria bacterium]
MIKRGRRGRKTEKPTERELDLEGLDLEQISQSSEKFVEKNRGRLERICREKKRIFRPGANYNSR